MAADWRALLREGEETNTVPFYGTSVFLTGYGDVMARAAALAQIEDLPEDMRRFVDTMLAEHEGHLAHDREVRGLVERVRGHWRRWPELGWAAQAQGQPVEELAEHGAWRAEGAALLEAATRLGADGDAARPVATHHLHAMPGARAGLEEAVASLERTRLLDDAERFERAWHALRQRAAESGVPELHVPGHRQVAELGERLEAAEELDTHVRHAVAEWRGVEAAQTALAEEVRSLPGRIAAWRERRADLPQDEHGGLDPKHPARQSWREEGATLEAAAGDMLRPEDTRKPYLDAQPGQRAAIGQAVEEVGEALRHDRYRTFAWLTTEVVRQARNGRIEKFHVPRYGEMVAEAKAFSGQAALPARTQELVAWWLDYHAGCERICRQIRDWPERADALAAECPERPAKLDALRGWRQRAKPLLEDARAMLAEDGPHAPHLDAMPDERKALVEARSRLQRELLAVEARETKLLSALAQRSVDKFHRDWQAHIAKATAAHVDPFYLTGHKKLIDRLQELRADPAAETLPSAELDRIDAILGESRRQTEALSTVKRHIAQIGPCLDELSQLKRTAGSQDTDLLQLPSYAEWRATAERLYAEVRAIADDRNTYGPCLDHTFMTWHKVHDGIRDLADALGHPTDSLLHRQPELYLQPIPRVMTILDETLQADASYRRLREQWHTHVARAEADGLHPYDLQNHAPLIEAMRELRDRPGLFATARRTLDTLLSDHDEYVQARADIQRFRLDWQRHLERADAAHAHPFYVPGHRSLIERLEQLMDRPGLAALPAPEKTGLAAILDQDGQQTEALSTVQRYMDRIDPCLDELRDLQRAANIQQCPLAQLPSYNHWRDTAEPLLAEAQSIAENPETYGACLEHTFRAWKKVHDGICKLSDPLDHDTDSLRHREPELYLEPVTHVASFSDELNQAAASYRRLREHWHDHMALAEEHRIHPYRMDGYAALIETMREVRELPGLEFEGCHSLDTLLAHHSQFHEARADIDRHLDEAAEALADLARLNDIAQGLKMKPERMPDYANRTETALRLEQAGKDILADRRRYGIHLKENPDLAQRIRASIRGLDRELRPKTPPPPQQQLQEPPEQSQKQTIRRSRTIRR